MSTPRPGMTVAIVMERETAPNRWEDWRHRLVEVIELGELGELGAGEPGAPPADASGALGGARGTAPRVLRDDGQTRRSLFPGFALQLFADEGEGYFLNLTSGQPVWFVMWRVGDEDPSLAWPEAVSVSYNEAGRWLDAQERVDNVPMSPEAVAWLQAYTDQHYRPEPKKRKRPVSFLPPEQR